jgi:hypothetical protein
MVVLRTTFGHKTEEVTRNWRRQRNEEAHNTYFSPSIASVRVTISRGASRARHPPRMRENENAYKILVGNPKERDRLKHIGIDRKMELKR